MCELLAVSSNRRVPISFTWLGFRQRGRIHRHGWGVAWYATERLAGMAKEPLPSFRSRIAPAVGREVRSHIMISHVRLLSEGSLSYVNTHPFIRRLWDRDWVFAHNGTVSEVLDDEVFRLEWCRPVGETDSEHAFCYMLERLSAESDGSVESVAQTVWDVAREIGGFGRFNFLLSEGVHVYAHMNVPGTLYYVTRHPPHRGEISLVDEDFQVRLGEMKMGDEYAAIIATAPLTDEEWTPMRPGTLYVFRGGNLLLTLDSRGPRLNLSPREAEALRIVRTSPHSVPLQEIARQLGASAGEAEQIVGLLVAKGLLRGPNPLSKGRGEPLQYYTEPMYRPLLDRALGL